MEESLTIYRRLVTEQPACEGSLFADALARYRAGDEMGARIISGSCLRLAMQIAEQRSSEFEAFDLLDVIQEANVGLWEAVTSFAGDNLEEFLRHAEERINQRLTVLV